MTTTVNPAAPTVPYYLEDGETFPVRVFRDHPEWDRCEKWWMMPSHLLRELFVATYDCEDGAQLRWCYDQHPGCVLVY